jgi:hypothetical protein
LVGCGGSTQASFRFFSFLQQQLSSHSGCLSLGTSTWYALFSFGETFTVVIFSLGLLIFWHVYLVRSLLFSFGITFLPAGCQSNRVLRSRCAFAAMVRLKAEPHPPDGNPVPQALLLLPSAGRRAPNLGGEFG